MGNSQIKQDISCELTDCLDLFQQEETIQWKCPQCKVTRDCSKGMQIWKLPNILIIHLKRFEFGDKVLGKITQKVNFPINDLQMSPYCFKQDNTIYNLYAVAQHLGSLQYGHYLSICKHRIDNQWYMYCQSIKRIFANFFLVELEANCLSNCQLKKTPTILVYGRVLL